MEPSAFDEMLRVLKPGGYVINAMKEQNRRKCVMYKDSFDKHCQKLVEEGKWIKVPGAMSRALHTRPAKTQFSNNRATGTNTQ